MQYPNSYTININHMQATIPQKKQIIPTCRWLYHTHRLNVGKSTIHCVSGITFRGHPGQRRGRTPSLPTERCTMDSCAASWSRLRRLRVYHSTWRLMVGRLCFPFKMVPVQGTCYIIFGGVDVYFLSFPIGCWYRYIIHNTFMKMLCF